MPKIGEAWRRGATSPSYRHCCHANKLRNLELRLDALLSGVPSSASWGSVAGNAHLGLSPNRDNMRYQSDLCANVLLCAGGNVWSAAADLYVSAIRRYCSGVKTIAQ